MHVVYAGVLGASGGRSKCCWRRCCSCSTTRSSVGAEGSWLSSVGVCRVVIAHPHVRWRGGLVVGSCTLMAVDCVAAAARCCWNCCPGDCRLPLSYERPLLERPLLERPLLPRWWWEWSWLERLLSLTPLRLFLWWVPRRVSLRWAWRFVLRSTLCPCCPRRYERIRCCHRQ